MLTDLEIAELCHKVTEESKKDKTKDDDVLCMDVRIIDGVKYLTFSAMDNDEFRKSYTLLSMLSDMLNLSPDAKHWYSERFESEWLSLKPFIMQHVEEDEKIPVILCGHGAAGGIALIAGYHLTMLHKNLKRVVTFGAPASLNSRTEKSPFMCVLKQITMQYVFKNDRMPKMFRWTKDIPANRTVLSAHGFGFCMAWYSEAMKLGDGGLL